MQKNQKLTLMVLTKVRANISPIIFSQLENLRIKKANVSFLECIQFFFNFQLQCYLTNILILVGILNS